MTTRYPAVPAIYPLGQCNVPLILQSSGTMGANGALSAITTLTVVYPNCYLWFPTGKAFSASPAGWYFTQMSSATAGTVFNNTYTSGTPTIPASPTAIVDSGPGAYTQTTASGIDSYQLSIPAGLLGINDALSIRSDIVQISNTNATKLASHVFGSTTIRNPALTVSTLTFNDEFEFFNMGIQTKNTTNPSSPTTLVDFGGSNTTNVLTTIDFTAAQTYKVTLQLGTATDYVGIGRLHVMRIPGVA